MEKLNEQELQRLREISIHAVLGCRNNGRRVDMCCPFHDDSSPSFSLYADNSYHCFGCGKHGRGAIDFSMHLNGLDQIKNSEQMVKVLSTIIPYL